jgi:hypothetical protein
MKKIIAKKNNSSLCVLRRNESGRFVNTRYPVESSLETLNGLSKVQSLYRGFLGKNNGFTGQAEYYWPPCNYFYGTFLADKVHGDGYIKSETNEFLIEARGHVEMGTITAGIIKISLKKDPSYYFSYPIKTGTDAIIFKRAFNEMRQDLIAEMHRIGTPSVKKQPKKSKKELSHVQTSSSTITYLRYRYF